MSTHTDDKLKDYNDSQKQAKAQKRIEEIEEILLEMSFTDPQFETLVLERNDLLIITTTK